MMKHQNQYHDSISTVPLGPFNEDQWNRIVTYSPMYVDWPDYITTNPRRSHKDVLRKRNLISPMHMKTVQLEDKLLLNELHTLQKTANLPTLTTFTERNSYKELQSTNAENLRRTTSPTDEYQRTADGFHLTTEPAKRHNNYKEHPRSNQIYSTKHSTLQPKKSTNKPLRAFSHLDLGPKPQTSLSVQLRQSAKTREQALAPVSDYNSPSLQSMSSIKRTVASTTVSNRPTNQSPRIQYLQTPPSTDTHIINGSDEKSATHTLSSVKRASIRSTNSSRTTVYMIKTKNDRAREKQHVELKTILIKTKTPGVLRKAALEKSIPNSLEKMRKLGGSMTAFEKNLDYNYHRQLNQFRIDMNQT